jgi:hypothetical protein
MMSKMKNPRFAWMVFKNCTWTPYRCTAVQCCWRYKPRHHQSRDKGVNTYDEVTDLYKDKLPTEELDRHTAFQKTICTQGSTAYQCYSRDPLFAQLVHGLCWKGMVVTSRLTWNTMLHLTNFIQQAKLQHLTWTTFSNAKHSHGHLPSHKIHCS